MVDRLMVLEVLQEARENVFLDWGSTNVNADARGATCASVGICNGPGAASTRLAAHVAFLEGAGIAVPETEDAILAAVYQFNDAQRNVIPVLTAFDTAMALLRAELEATPEPTPNADATIEVMAACHAAGMVVARRIVALHPQMDLAEITDLAAAELFYAAQDTTRVCALGVKQLHA